MTIFIEVVPIDCAGMRLDQVLAQLFTDFSRSKLQSWNKCGKVMVNGNPLKSKDRLEGGETIELDAEAEVVIKAVAEPIPLQIVFEDEAILIVNKPAGLVVHPAIGNWQGTLLNALLNHLPILASLPRAGIVHRIDKGTSGLLMVAKTQAAHHSLVGQLQARTIHREYIALCCGRMTAGGTIDTPIGRHPNDRIRYAIRESGKPAVTHYRVLQRFNRYTQVQVKLETGRTHQIRVHMESIRYPLVGDPVYGGRLQIPPNCNTRFEVALRAFKRQALHAAKLGLVHPGHGEYLEWEIALPEDMQNLLEALSDYDKTLDQT
jgi:23S rRNA pseudouridine1911/1915/1917 synthase